MSHYPVTVVLAGYSGNIEADLAAALAPFDENGDNCQNPKWDDWRIGGRWRSTLRYSPSATRADLIHPDDEGRCDGGFHRALDLQAIRAAEAHRAAVDWDAYMEAVTGTPTPTLWPVFLQRVLDDERRILGGSWFDAVDRVRELERIARDWPPDDEGFSTWLDRQPIEFIRSAELDSYEDAVGKAVEALRTKMDAARGYTVERAGVDYHQQERVALGKSLARFRYWTEGPVEQIDPFTREHYVANAVADAVPGYALLTGHGRWVARGEVERLGLGTENEDSISAYRHEANRIIDDTPGDHVIVIVDCHV